MSPKLFALLSTVALLFFMILPIFGSLPLLVLKHDTPMDARFVRAVFNFFYIAVMSAAAVAALGYGNFGRPAFALGMGGVMAYAFVVRRSVLSRMDALRAAIRTSDPAAIQQFRRLHRTAILLNVLPLVAVAAGATKLAL